MLRQHIRASNSPSTARNFMSHGLKSTQHFNNTSSRKPLDGPHDIYCRVFFSHFSSTYHSRTNKIPKNQDVIGMPRACSRSSMEKSTSKPRAYPFREDIYDIESDSSEYIDNDDPRGTFICYCFHCYCFKLCYVAVDLKVIIFPRIQMSHLLSIPTNHAGLIEYRGHPFWIQKYCPFHEHCGTPRCCSSERIELCLECLDSAIMDTSECQPLFLDIQEFYEGLNMKLEQQVPLFLVERQALNEARERRDKCKGSLSFHFMWIYRIHFLGHYHIPKTRGLCLSEEQTISTILRCPRFGAGNRAMDMKTGPYKLTCNCEVTTILILYGLPRYLNLLKAII
ncbi:hypothetical protein UlMin_006944 [Ulmus minor]